MLSFRSCWSKCDDSLLHFIITVVHILFLCVCLNTAVFVVINVYVCVRQIIICWLTIQYWPVGWLLKASVVGCKLSNSFQYLGSYTNTHTRSNKWMGTYFTVWVVVVWSCADSTAFGCSFVTLVLEKINNKHNRKILTSVISWLHNFRRLFQCW